MAGRELAKKKMPEHEGAFRHQESALKVGVRTGRRRRTKWSGGPFRGPNARSVSEGQRGNLLDGRAGASQKKDAGTRGRVPASGIRAQGGSEDRPPKADEMVRRTISRSERSERKRRAARQPAGWPGGS